MIFDITEALYYIIPAAALIFFGISLFRYLYAKHKNKRTPGTYSEAQIKSRKVWLIVSSVIVGTVATVALALIGLNMMAKDFYMMSVIISLLYYLIPISTLIFFAFSLYRYHYAKYQNKRTPGTYSDAQIKSRKICLIVSLVIAGILAVVVLAFIGLLMMAVAFM